MKIADGVVMSMIELLLKNAATDEDGNIVAVEPPEIAGELGIAVSAADKILRDMAKMGRIAMEYPRVNKYPSGDGYYPAFRAKTAGELEYLRAIEADREDAKKAMTLLLAKVPASVANDVAVSANGSQVTLPTSAIIAWYRAGAK